MMLMDQETKYHLYSTKIFILAILNYA